MTGAALPDVDGDGIPDFQQAVTGNIYTGLSGSGCVIPQVLNSSKPTRVDPTLQLLAVLAAYGLALRRRVIGLVKD